jgi:hypothetical protein
MVTNGTAKSDVTKIKLLTNILAEIEEASGGE